jgi:hypothetical protein
LAWSAFPSAPPAPPPIRDEGDFSLLEVDLPPDRYLG